MHIDCTNARVNWESAHVFVNATPDGKVYYSASTKKGHAGVEGTPAENYQGILVHDHELTFYNYGSDHQECLAHVLRYLKDSMQNEANLTWSTKMHRFIQEIIHYRNSIEPGSVIDEAKLKEIEQKYTDLLKTARDKYDYEIVYTAPVERVSDTFSLTRFVDATLYVCRADYTHKNSVFNVEDFVAEGSLKNVMFVLNDTEIKKTYGYSVKHTRG